MTILVEIPTKDRDSILGRCLAALLQQSYQDFDILILNDGSEEVGRTPTTNFVLECLSHDHDIWIEDGSHISQAHNHNVPLYDERFAKYHEDGIVRLDDDLLLHRRAIEYMIEAKRGLEAAGEPVGAIGGLWFDSGPAAEYISADLHDRKIFWTREEMLSNPSVNPRVGDINSNWQQRMYHPEDDVLMAAQHIYSVCLYNPKAMIEVGGWPEVYSKGAAHGEETDGTYRMYLAGYSLYINPSVHGEHLRSPGGIRKKRDLSQVQSMDLLRWQHRYPLFEGINFDQPTVAIECRHCYGLGGAERLFYHTVHLLQSKSGLDVVHPIFPGTHHTPDDCEEAFGFRYEEPGERLEEYDILIVLGHEPTHFTRAKKKILYCFFPLDISTADLREFDSIVGISDYTQHWIGEMWRCKARRIYPPVEPITQFFPSGMSMAGDVVWAKIDKENVILVVARCVPYKGPLWLMERFAEWELDGWKMHLVTATSVEAFGEYEKDVIRFAEGHEDITLHRNVSRAVLEDLYRRAKIFWGAAGMHGTAPTTAEHFGYTPVEAWSAGCLPIMYDRGGHQETVSETYRWNTMEDLERITRSAMVLFDPEKSEPPVYLARYAPSRYALQWENLIRRVNGMAIETEWIQELATSVHPIRVGMFCDSPFLPEHGIGVTTGFGMVARMLALEILKHKDMHLSIYGLMDNKYIHRTTQRLPFDYYTPFGADIEGKQTLPHFVYAAKPDVLWALHAPGDLVTCLSAFRKLDNEMPIVAYFPVEGNGRINAAIPDLLNMVQYPVTYCQAGAEIIARYTDRTIDWAWHGIDHAEFAPLSQKERARLREMVDWKDKLVVFACGTNKRVKNHPVLIDAMRILLERGHDNIYMYLHTKMAESTPILAGWNLRNIIGMDGDVSGLPLSEHIYKPFDYDKLRGAQYDGDDLQTWRWSRPPEAKQRGALFNALGLVQRYGMADLAIDVSSAEGFGLPILELAACGVPAVSVNDGMARTEIHSRYCHMLEPEYWDTWHTGTKLAMVGPEQVADKIVELAEDESLRFKYADKQAKIMDELSWQPTVDKFIGLIREAHGLQRES